jgi:hypothetical protein
VTNGAGVSGSDANGIKSRLVCYGDGSGNTVPSSSQCDSIFMGETCFSRHPQPNDRSVR